MQDRRLLRAVSSLCEPYMGLPPSRLSFIAWAAMTMSYITGTYQCRGGFQHFADAFVHAIERRGGTVALRTPVQRVLTRDGRISGVAGGNWQVTAPVVVAAMDPRQLPRLLGPGALPRRYRRRLQNTEVTSPSLAVYLATDLQIDPDTTVYETLHATTDSLTLGPGDGLGIHIPTLVDPSQAPPGQHLVKLSIQAGFEAEDPFALASDLIGRADKILPGLADHLIPVDPDAPTSYAVRRFSAPYGWACTPIGASIGRLRHTTPIRGLYLAGQWTHPAHGIPSVVASGARVARIITQERQHQPLLPLG